MQSWCMLKLTTSDQLHAGFMQPVVCGYLSCMPKATPDIITARLGTTGSFKIPVWYNFSDVDDNVSDDPASAGLPHN